MPASGSSRIVFSDGKAREGFGLPRLDVGSLFYRLAPVRLSAHEF